MSGLDGPTLRAVRENLGYPLRRIARAAGMSHGHLSKVERGEHGRPVTPAIMAAYERVTGVKLTEAAAQVAERRDRDTGRRGRTWRPGEMTDLRRRGFNAAVGAIAIGGHLGEPTGRLLDSTGRPVIPTPPEPDDIGQVETLAGCLTRLDLAHGGGLASQVGKAVLRWAVPMLDHTPTMDPADGARLAAAIATLAHRAAWSAFDVGGHEAARSLYRLALYAAVAGQVPDLRAHVLADVAAGHSQVGYHHDALEIIRLAEGDDRITPAVRMVLHGVRARAHANLGEADACRRQVEAAEQAHRAAAQPVPPGAPTGGGWTATVATSGRLAAIAGHALAVLCRHTGSAQHRQEALTRLGTAVDQLDPAAHARAVALCQARLARLHLDAGDTDQAHKRYQQATELAEHLRSGRLAHQLAELAATLDPDQPPHADPDRGDRHQESP